MAAALDEARRAEPLSLNRRGLPLAPTMTAFVAHGPQAQRIQPAPPETQLLVPAIRSNTGQCDKTGIDQFSSGGDTPLMRLESPFFDVVANRGR
jgi:hypothetical protein